MEITCSRCHQAITEETCFCPYCGLPQLVYSSEEQSANVPAERWSEAVRDASAVDWKPALRAAALLAIPAGVLSCGVFGTGFLGFFWMAAAASWAVSLYVRRQRPAWITMGAGARIGLATGLIGGWFAFAVTAAVLFAMRALHQAQGFDEMWQAMVNQITIQQAQNADANTLATFKALFLSPEGRAGGMLCSVILLEIGYLIFAVVGGALGARMTARWRRPQA